MSSKKQPQKANPKKEITQRREREIWDLRQDSMPFRKIADRMKMSEAGVRGACQRYGRKLANEHKEEAHEIRVAQTDYLERICEKAMSAWERQKKAAFLRVIVEAKKQIREMWGVNAPAASTVKVSGEVAALVPTAALTRDQMQAALDAAEEKRNEQAKH